MPPFTMYCQPCACITFAPRLLFYALVCVCQVRDTRQAISDCRAGLNDAVDVDGGDGFLESLTAQLAALQEELWAVFVDGGPDRVEKELALARRAATRASAGVYFVTVFLFVSLSPVTTDVCFFLIDCIHRNVPRCTL